MPRPGPKEDDLDFEIHVDTSCLSESMAEDDVPTKIEEEKKKEDAMKDAEKDDPTKAEELVKDARAVEATEETETKAEEPKADEKVESTTETSKEASEPEAEAVASEIPPAESTDTTPDDEPAAAAEVPEPTPEPKQEAEKEEAAQAELEPQPESLPEEEAEEQKTATEDPKPESEAELKDEKAAETELDITPEELAALAEESIATAAKSEDTPPPAVVVEDAEDEENEPAEVREASRSSSSLRRSSGQTEALIQAAAKEVLERLEAQTMETMRNRPHSPRDSMDSTRDGTEIHYDTRSDTTRRESYRSESQASYRDSRRENRRGGRRETRRESDALPSPRLDDGDSSSQHGADSDVFSDRSPRSSLGSFDGHIDHHKDTSHRASKRSSRMSDASMSEMSYYDKEDFVPTIRGTNRMPFRTPSDVRALQYSSPAPSVVDSPRSNKKHHMPTISRLGSPTVSAQFSPKGRTTPTRFKAKKEPAPLVLLHVTLLPLRWQWAEILESTSSHILSPEAKTLREAWHHLHDRVADTVCERGILLSHPQEDYELLEERLLEALDLPLRRRARVLQCGHYIGPSNESTLTEDTDSDEDEYDEETRRKNDMNKTHWCQTCRHEIRYESLGPGKIFRIKVYASNGLMRTGAWAACWKEMERVDVEIEPIVTSGVLDELERLVMFQTQQMQSQQMELVKHDPTILESTEGRDSPDNRHRDTYEREMSDHLDRDMHTFEEPPQEESYLEETHLLEPKYIEHKAPSPAVEEHHSPAPEPMPRHNDSEERRLRDEARMREIYGLNSPAPESAHEAAPEPEPHHESYSSQSPPPPQQPHEQAEHHHQEQHHQHQSPPTSGDSFPQHQHRQQPYQNAGLAELLLEAARVFMQDKKNLAIVVMSLLMLFMAVKPAQREVKEWDGKFVEQITPEMSEAPVEPPVMDTIQAVVESVVSPEASIEVIVEPSQETRVAESSQGEVLIEATPSIAEPSETPSGSMEVSPSEEEQFASSPTASPSREEEAPAPSGSHEAITTRELVRIVETVTETVKAIVTETEVVKAEPTASVTSEDSTEEDVPADVDGSVEEDVPADAEASAVPEASSEWDESVEEATSAVEEEEEELVESEETMPTKTEEATSTETALPTEETMNEEVAEDESTIEETLEEEKVETTEPVDDDEIDHDEL